MNQIKQLREISTNKYSKILDTGNMSFDFMNNFGNNKNLLCPGTSRKVHQIQSKYFSCLNGKQLPRFAVSGSVDEQNTCTTKLACAW